MKIKKYLFIFLLFSTCFSAIAQYEYPGDTETKEDGKKQKKGWYKESKLYFGGNLGLSFGTYTYVEIAPLVGYRITPRLSAGLGPKYMYIKESNYYETNIYGAKTFALFSIFKNINETINIGIGDIFVYGESEFFNVEPGHYVTVYYPPAYFPDLDYLVPKYIKYQKDSRRWLNVTLIGGGLRFPLGGRAGFSIMALWDVTQNPYYSYSNPELRISVDF